MKKITKTLVDCNNCPAKALATLVYELNRKIYEDNLRMRLPPALPCEKAKLLDVTNQKN